MKPIVAFFSIFRNCPKKNTEGKNSESGWGGNLEACVSVRICFGIDHPRLVISDAGTPATNKTNNISHSPDHNNGQEQVGEDEGEVDGCH